MPTHIRIMVSIAAALASLVLFYMDTQAGVGTARWVALGIGPLMVLSIWIFPEPNTKSIRKEVAERRHS